MLSLRSNLIPVHILPVCPCTPEELKPVENKGSPDTREACVLCVAALACPPHCGFFFFFIPLRHSLQGLGKLDGVKKKKIPCEQTGNLLSSPVCSFLSVVVPLIPTLAVMSFLLTLLFQSQQEEEEVGKSQSKNGKVCPHAGFLLIPPTVSPPMESTYTGVCTGPPPCARCCLVTAAED